MPKPTNGTAPTRHSGRWVRYLGWLIVAFALAYLGTRLAVNFSSLTTFDLSGARLSLLGACGVAFGAALVPLAVMWGRLAHPDPASRPPLWQTLSIYGRSQIAKYLPGNVFHYAGRQVLGHRLNWPQAGMALASGVEILLLAAAAAAVVLVYGVAVGGAVFSPLPKAGLAAGLVTCVAAPWGLIAGAPYVPGLRHLIPRTTSARIVRGTLLPMALLVYLAYFAAAGALAWLTLGTLGLPLDPALLPTVAAGFVASWLVGYLTPGASGGIGVREASLVLLLGGPLGEPNALALALVLRVTTTLGDVLNYGASALLHRVFNRKAF